MIRSTFPRESYLPPQVRDVAPTVPEGTDLAVWTWEGERRTTKGPITAYAAIAFAGKASKPLWHYWFRTAEQRQREIDDAVAGRRATLKLKSERVEERRSYRHDYKPGDVLVSSWGYDQTNVNFYQVLEVRGALVVLREVVQAGAGPTAVLPRHDTFCGPEIKRKPGVGGYVRIDNVQTAHKWDGRPEYQTASGWGH